MPMPTTLNAVCSWFGMSRLRVIAPAAAMAGVAGVALMGGLAPEPDPVPRRWQFDVKLGDLRMARINLEGGGVGTYFYLPYQVTNGTREDLLFAPQWELATDEGDVVRSGRDVPAEVTRQIIARLGNPLILDQVAILGPLLQGEENAKDGVVIWAAPDLNVDEVAIYATGFSGETKPYEVRDPATGKMRPELLRKTLMLRYDIPGDLMKRGNQPFPTSERRWIMR